jgi:hypothetical protein
MKHLNKIVFIHSANVSFQQIELNGNCHFIGDQGVGKSTILRSILFFYNSNQQQLGISQNKKSFAEYYFQNPNSHIIYEVIHDNAKFSVWLYKENNQICFRFIPGAFNEKYFLEQSNSKNIALSPEKVLEKIREQARPTRKLQSKEFRDILYGASREFPLYSIMQSNIYQNIPITISKVFLNSSLDSEKIREVIINCIVEDNENEKGNRIDLAIIRNQLNDFRNDFDDIADFEKTRQKAQHIVSIYDEILKAEQNRILIAQNLGHAIKYSEKQILVLTSKIAEIESQQTVNDNNIKVLKENYSKDKKIIDDDLAVVNGNLNTTNEKISYYKQQNINEILARVDKEQILKNENKTKSDRKNLITSQFSGIEEKYKAYFDQITNEENIAEGTNKEQINILKEKLLEQRQKIGELYDIAITELNERFDKQKEEAEQKKKTQERVLQNLKDTRAEINNKRYFETQINELVEKIQEFKNNQIQKQANLKLKKGEVDKHHKLYEIEKEKDELIYKSQLEKKQLKLKQLQEKFSDLEIKISSWQNSFYEFLDINYPDWTETIGKVCNDDNDSILFQNNLHPEIISNEKNLFGVKIDLTEIKSNVKTLNQYQLEKDDLQTDIDKKNKEIEQFINENEKHKDDLIKKFNDKIKPVNKEIQQIERIELPNLTTNIEKFGSDLETKKADAIKEKAKELAQIEPKIKDIQAEIVKIEVLLATEKENHIKLIVQKKSDKTYEISLIEKSTTDEIQNKKNELFEIKSKIKEKRNEIESQKYNELQGKGLDTSEIEKLEKRITEIFDELAEIEKLNKGIVSQYNYDKRNFIDKLSDFGTQITLLRIQLTQLSTTFNSSLTELIKIQNSLSADHSLFRQTHKKLIENLEHYTKYFENSDLYKELEFHILNADYQEIQDNLIDIIANLQSEHNLINTKNEDFKTSITSFVSPFRENNIFKFKKAFSGNTEFRDFAENLKEFIAENKIDRYKKDTKRMLGDIIKNIVEDINDLTSKRKAIDEILSKITQDFEKRNFVGVIQKIELKSFPTANRIVQALEEIKQFNDENPYSIDTLNLFSAKKWEDNRDKAAMLLEGLMKYLKETPRNEITLEDTFELRFRVIENQNDSGWREKLHDIGSEGTDILVKAMIYIMLLAVFKEKATKKKDFMLHCIMDEVGKIHTKNISGLIKFANDRDIWMINGSPNEDNALAYHKVYSFERDQQTNKTRVYRLTSIK